MTQTFAAQLSFNDLACIRGERVLFTQLTAQVAASGALRLIGPNGSGKTSLLRILAGLAQPAHGAIAWQGQPVAADRAAHHGRVLFVGHLDAVKPYLTVRENVAFWAGLYDATDTIDSAIAALDLTSLADLPAKFLSAGQRRRVTLARLFVARVPLWLLDEPTVSLDDAAIRAVESAIEKHRTAGGIVVVATHTPLRMDGAAEIDFGRPPALRAA